jgi:hypothetical protein
MGGSIVRRQAADHVAILAQGTSWAVAVTQAFCCTHVSPRKSCKGSQWLSRDMRSAGSQHATALRRQCPLAAALGDAPYEVFARVPDHGGRGLRRGKEGGGGRL